MLHTKFCTCHQNFYTNLGNKNCPNIYGGDTFLVAMLWRALTLGKNLANTEKYQKTKVPTLILLISISRWYFQIATCRIVLLLLTFKTALILSKYSKNWCGICDFHWNNIFCVVLVWGVHSLDSRWYFKNCLTYNFAPLTNLYNHTCFVEISQ